MPYSSALKLKSPKALPPKSRSKRSTISGRLAASRRSSKNLGRPLLLYAKLDGFQKEAVEFCAGRTGSALFFEQGTGKTWITLGLIEYLDLETAMLIVPLTNLQTTWAKTIRAELPEYKICYSWKEFKEAGKQGFVKRILLVHYEALPNVINQTKKFSFELVAFDESQRLKSRSSRNSRLARRFRHHERRLVLSGTPMDKSPTDCWAQIRFADHTVFGENWSRSPEDFANKFCYKGGFMGKKWIFRTGSGDKVFKKRRQDPQEYDDHDMMPEFLHRMKQVALRVEKKDVLDNEVPEIIPVYIPLLGHQRKLYERMDTKSVIRVDGVRIMAEMEMTKRMKLAQITGGIVFDEEKNILHVGNAKSRKLNTLIKRIDKQFDSPVVVFCQFTEEIEIVKRVLKRHYKRIGVLHGKVKDTKTDDARSRIQREFQAGKLDALICQVKTGGVGIDLFFGHVAIFYSFSHSWIDFDQACARLDRRGQIDKVFIYLLICQNTIDEDKLEAVRSKCSLTTAILRRLKPRSK